MVAAAKTVPSPDPLSDIDILHHRHSSSSTCRCHFPHRQHHRSTPSDHRNSIWLSHHYITSISAPGRRPPQTPPDHRHSGRHPASRITATAIIPPLPLSLDYSDVRPRPPPDLFPSASRATVPNSTASRSATTISLSLDSAPPDPSFSANP